MQIHDVANLDSTIHMANAYMQAVLSENTNEIDAFYIFFTLPARRRRKDTHADQPVRQQPSHGGDTERVPKQRAPLIFPVLWLLLPLVGRIADKSMAPPEAKQHLPRDGRHGS